MARRRSFMKEHGDAVAVGAVLIIAMFLFGICSLTSEYPYLKVRSPCAASVPDIAAPTPTPAPVQQTPTPTPTPVQGVACGSLTAPYCTDGYCPQGYFCTSVLGTNMCECAPLHN